MIVEPKGHLVINLETRIQETQFENPSSVIRLIAQHDLYLKFYLFSSEDPAAVASDLADTDVVLIEKAVVLLVGQIRHPAMDCKSKSLVLSKQSSLC